MSNDQKLPEPRKPDKNEDLSENERLHGYKERIAAYNMKNARNMGSASTSPRIEDWGVTPPSPPPSPQIIREKTAANTISTRVNPKTGEKVVTVNQAKAREALRQFSRALKLNPDAKKFR